MRWEYVVSPETIVGQAHASTIVETSNRDLVCAWFGGAREGDHAVAIWMSRRTADGWSKATVVVDEPDVPTWNPVLFRDDAGCIWLFYQVGYTCDTWSGFVIKSTDDGKTWSSPEIMPAGLFGPIKNKPIRLADGRIACGSSVESYNAWTGWIHIYDPKSGSWSIRGPLAVPDTPRGLIQPTLWEVMPGHIRSYLRSTREIGYICTSDSEDNGETWSVAERTALPNPNSGIDAVKLADGRVVLIYNHTQRTDKRSGREIIHVAVSSDDGETWSAPWVIEDEGTEYSYPAVIQGVDGTVHVTYTWNRIGVRYASFSPEEIDRIADGTMERLH